MSHPLYGLNAVILSLYQAIEMGFTRNTKDGVKANLSQMIKLMVEASLNDLLPDMSAGMADLDK